MEHLHTICQLVAVTGTRITMRRYGFVHIASTYYSRQRSFYITQAENREWLDRRRVSLAVYSMKERKDVQRTQLVWAIFESVKCECTKAAVVACVNNPCDFECDTSTCVAKRKGWVTDSKLGKRMEETILLNRMEAFPDTQNMNDWRKRKIWEDSI